jgi:hypothetical protein
MCDYKLPFNPASLLTIKLYEICTLQKHVPEKKDLLKTKLANSNIPTINSDNVFLNYINIEV